MANYHFTVKVMSRADNRNAVAGATYRHGQSMTDEKSGKRFVHMTDQDVEHSELSIPENAPQWAKDLLVGDVHKNSEKLWNAVEQFEKRSDAQVYREVEFSLPQELTKEQRLDLAREFIKEQFTSCGMIADWSVHNHFDEKDSIEKPHVHVMLTMRELKETETLEKVKGALGFSSSPINFGQKMRDWNSKYLLKNWREKWADCANTHLSKAGLDIRIDHRSYEDQGVEFIPQPKLGKAVSEIQERGLEVDRLTQMREVQEYNLNLIRKNPDIVLDYISRYQSTFTREDIAKVLNRYIDDRSEFMHLFAKIEASSKLVQLTGTEQGEASRLTTKEIIKLESQICDLATPLSSTLNFVSDPSVIELAIGKGHERLKQFGGLSTDQERAIRHMVSDGQLKVIVGYAGAGKTTTLEVAQEIWSESGYKVIGAAPTGRAASNLEAIGIPSKTFHKWEREWKNGREQLDETYVMILDEAGMVDTRKVHSLITESHAKGFKVVFVGDPEQLSPIEAGAPVRAIMERIGFAEISTIVRQQVDWQKEATQDLALRQTAKALATYDQKGHVYFDEKAKEELIQNWASYCHEQTLENSSRTALILAFFNKDVQELNELAREEAKTAGRLQGPDHQFIITKQKNIETLDRSDEEWNAKSPCLEREARDFALGEQIIFLRNDYNLNVKNGQLAKITDIQEKSITVEKDDKQVLTFDIEAYSFVDYGYATTIHKSQGTTVDKTFVYASRYMNRHLTYVALSRHREDVQVYADTEVFKDKNEFINTLSQISPKENVLDHISLDEQRTFMQRRSLSSVASYISWDAIKGLTYKVWSQAKDWMFGDMSHHQSNQSEIGSSMDVNTSIDVSVSALSDLVTQPKLPQASLSALEVRAVNETLKNHDFNIPDGVFETQYNQLVANTFSYLKAIQLDDGNAMKEKELLIKACFIQSHLPNVEMDYRNNNWSSEKVLAITAMASHLWYQEKEDFSYSFVQSCLTNALDLYEGYQGLYPKAIAAYQRMYPDLEDEQLSALTLQAIRVAEFSNQLLTEENLETMAHPFLEGSKDSSSKITQDVLELENNRYLQSMLKDQVFGEVTQENTLESVSHSKSSEVFKAFSELTPLSLSENQLETIRETLFHYDFAIPEGLQEQHYEQLVAHTFSYLKSIHLEEISPAKEQELLVKACFIQCHLKDVALDEKNQACSTQQIFALTTMASQLWYQEKDDFSHSFEQSCLAQATDLQTAYQDLFPKVMDAYQHMYSHLSEENLNTLAQQAIEIAQLSNQPLTQENLNTLAQSVLGTSVLNTTDMGTSSSLSSTLHEQETLPLRQELSSRSESLDSEVQQQFSPSISLKLDPSLEKVTAHLLDRYRHQESQLDINQKELHLDYELER